MAPTTARRPDPGGIFDSDEHRRVAGNLGIPRTLDELAKELYADVNTNLWEGEPGDHSHVESIVSELVDDGHVKKPDKDGRWELSAAGLEALCAPHPDPPPPLDPEQAARVKADWVASERAHVDQAAEAAREEIKRAHDDALAALDENVKAHEQTLKRLLDEDGS